VRSRRAKRLKSQGEKRGARRRRDVNPRAGPITGRRSWWGQNKTHLDEEASLAMHYGIQWVPDDKVSRPNPRPPRPSMPSAPDRNHLIYIPIQNKIGILVYGVSYSSI
jgi:hypothetical protein